ncbi:replication protein A 70 kDa DNA-binding subunit B [Tanacetum coccineum]
MRLVDVKMETANGMEDESKENMNKKITPISQVDPMLENISVQGRRISIWHSHRLNAANDPYSLDLVLQDAQNNRIEVYIKKEFMFCFEPLFEECQCYIVSNFGIAENGGRLPLLPHRSKVLLGQDWVPRNAHKDPCNLLLFEVLESQATRFHASRGVVRHVGTLRAAIFAWSRLGSTQCP